MVKPDCAACISTRISPCLSVPRPDRQPASIASPAFLSTLVSACDNIVASISAQISSSGIFNSNITSGCPDSCNVTAAAKTSFKFSDFFTNSGILANLENSSTIRRKSLVCRIITSVICSSWPLSAPSCGANFR